jgi:hypothetical protein
VRSLPRRQTNKPSENINNNDVVAHTGDRTPFSHEGGTTPLEEDDEDVRSVPWPTTCERLVREIKNELHEMYLPPGYYLDRSDPEVLILRSPEGEFVARFSAPGYLAESVEQQAWEDHRQRNMRRPPPK